MSPTSGTDPHPDRALIPATVASWPTQIVEDCAAYRPGPTDEVVYVSRFVETCIAKVPFGASVIFSASQAGDLGGVGWAKSSQPWVQIDGHQVMRKVDGDEFMISSRAIQGIWTDSPREYAVYVGLEAAAALDALGSSADS